MFEREEASARAEQQRRIVRQDTNDMEKLVDVIETVDEVCFQKNEASQSEGESSLAYLSSREYSNETKSPDSFSTCPESVPVSNNSKEISSIDARHLQDRIQAERDRVKMKRDKIQQQRSEAASDIEENDTPHRRSVDIAALTCLTISPFTSKASLERDPIQSAYDDLLQPLEDNATIETTPDVEQNLQVFDPIEAQTPSHALSPTEKSSSESLEQFSSKVQPLSTATRKQKAMSLESRNRAIKWTCFFTLLTIMVVTLVLVDKARDRKSVLLGKTENDQNSSSSQGGDDVSCQNATNVFPECICRKKFESSFTDAILYNRELVKKYLVANNAIKNSTSPESCDHYNQALMWVSDLSNYPEGTTPSNLEIMQRYSLSVLFQKLGGNNWNRKSSWLKSHSSECDWEGIMCSSITSDVQEINLMDNALMGTLPVAEFRSLTALQQLILDKNLDLVGKLASDISTLPLLQTLSISETRISGSLPTAFGSFLAVINLSATKLEGNLPSELGSLLRLRELDLSNNRLTGTIPQELLKSSRLEKLNLSSNLLTGTLLSEWSTPFLDELNLSDNSKIKGNYPLPPSDYLTYVNFADTALAGTVPTSYCNLDFLKLIMVDCQNGVPPQTCPCCVCT
jgi:Leucine Rich Repeat